MWKRGSVLSLTEGQADFLGTLYTLIKTPRECDNCRSLGVLCPFIFVMRLDSIFSGFVCQLVLVVALSLELHAVALCRVH